MRHPKLKIKDATFARGATFTRCFTVSTENFSLTVHDESVWRAWLPRSADGCDISLVVGANIQASKNELDSSGICLDLQKEIQDVQISQKVSNISRTKSQNLNASRLIL